MKLLADMRLYKKYNVIYNFEFHKGMSIKTIGPLFSECNFFPYGSKTSKLNLQIIRT